MCKHYCFRLILQVPDNFNRCTSPYSIDDGVSTQPNIRYIKSEPMRENIVCWNLAVVKVGLAISVDHTPVESKLNWFLLTKVELCELDCRLPLFGMLACSVLLLKWIVRVDLIWETKFTPLINPVKKSNFSNYHSIYD